MRVGSLMLGTWSAQFKAKVKQIEPYRTVLRKWKITYEHILAMEVSVRTAFWSTC